MPLRGKIPKQENMRLKAFLYGPPASGKTLSGLQFPDSYIIDTAKETDRYCKLINLKNSEVFNCSDPFEVMKELETLINEKHRFKTIIIDEVSTLYQNLQRMWTDKFIAAQQARGKNSPVDLLEDFGFRYWDKVKRDWKRFIDLLRQVDMNVIVNAQQKDEYGTNQQIIGVTADSDKKDRHAFDFVFRLIKRGKDYRAITEKQRILPPEIDPESKQFPKEFEWNYENLLKFYHKQYIEAPVISSDLKNNKQQKSTQENTPDLGSKIKKETNNKSEQELKQEEDKQIEQDKEQKENKSIDDFNKKINNIDKIKSLLKKENISIKEFKIFLQEIVKWKHVNVLTALTSKEQDVLLNNWNEKIIPNFNKIYRQKQEQEQENKEIEKEESKKEEKQQRSKDKPVYEPNKPIREDQIETIMSALEEEGVTVKQFFGGFMIKEWGEINQEGAENMIKNIKVMIGAFEE